MDIKTGLAIYNQPWLIEPQAAVRMLDYWERVVSKNEGWDYSRLRAEEKDQPSFSSYHFLQNSLTGGAVAAPRSRYEMRDFKGFDGATVAVFSVSGPIMKHDFCGDFGTQSLKAMLQLANKTESIESIVFLLDSPGGTVDGTETFADEIKNSPKNTIGIIGGLCCSGCYWIGSSCKELYATAETDIIGSIGTMMAWRDNSKMLEGYGIKEIEVYATRSTDKNKVYTDAAKGDSRALIKEMLDPLNSVFLTAVQANRAGKLNLKQEDVLTGKTYLANKSVEVGLIDGIRQATDVMNGLLSKSKSQKSIKMSNTNSGLAFGLVLAAAGASAFEVVDGGFMLTEGHLNGIEAKLDLDAVTASTTARSLKTLQAQEQSFTANATAVDDLETANATIADLNTKLAAANERISALEKLPGGSFAETTAEEDPAPDAEQQTPKLTSADRRAKELLD